MLSPMLLEGRVLRSMRSGKAHWEVLLRARAIETQCYVIAAAQVGGRTSPFGPAFMNPMPMPRRAF